MKAAIEKLRFTFRGMVIQIAMEPWRPGGSGAVFLKC